MNILFKILIFYIIAILITPKGYISVYPSLPIYPNNEREILLVKKEVSSRTKPDVDFFKLTDKSIVYSFLPLVDENYEELNSIITQNKIIIAILANKYSINRARPYQVCSSLNYLSSSTDKTPSYPAGHAFQAYYLAKVLGNRYPDKQKQFAAIAENCDNVRVKAGIHYPSDGRYSKKIVDLFF